MLDYLGYAASTIILISLLMSQPKKLRWINLLGAITFAVYGFLINSIPVGVMNAGISVINIYYLVKMYRTNDYFNTLPIDKNSVYLKNFLEFYKEDIAKFFNTNDIDVDNSDVSFYILRNVMPAGLFVGNKINDETLRIDFDYVVPAYRDFQMGKYIFVNQKKIFTSKGFNTLVTYTDNEKHEKYLRKMGFNKTESDIEEKACYIINL